MDNRLEQLRKLGQSIWLDNLGRSLIAEGGLQRLIDEDGVSGITTNPAIFEAAINSSDAYDVDIQTLSKAGKNVEDIYRKLTVDDVIAAAELLQPQFEQSDGVEGFVSLEVSPHLARETEATLIEARELWQALGRDNVFIKVPGTAEGIPAIRQLISEGINVNVTLLFSVERYAAVRQAWLEGLEARHAAGKNLKVASVASFFLSRIDTLVDPLLEQTGSTAVGQVAIAAAKLAYADYRAAMADPRIQTLASAGANPQRLLWASTGTKNPAYGPCHYIDPLVGADTITTVPLQTLATMRSESSPSASLEQGVAEAQSLVDSLPSAGVDLKQVEQQLEEEGLVKFTQPHEKLMAALASKREQIINA